MKQTSTLNQINFTVLTQSRIQRVQPKSFSMNIVKRITAKRELLQLTIATLGIGLTLLLSFYLFFTQLAEYGW
ncbi:MAG: hypothetical protein GY702_18215 [Desulfobulbaceae bacterium]|nr:hypothetical protein [Desulfobulbaceae bacterium]